MGGKIQRNETFAKKVETFHVQKTLKESTHQENRPVILEDNTEN